MRESLDLRLPRNAEIVRLRLRGVPPRRIARVLEVPRPLVYQVVYMARQSGTYIPFLGSTGRGTARTVLVPIHVLDELEPAAARRGLSAVALAREIITTVVTEGILSAVLDDEPEARRVPEGEGCE